ILKIAVRVGVEFQVKWVEDEKIMVVVRKEKVKKAIEKWRRKPREEREPES
ncbi:PREDICTED: UDP-glycosyltransferase, partial [Prunus dulcis]